MNQSIINIAKQKANNSKCRFKISAIGFSNKGNLLGTANNFRRFDGKGKGLHAEIKLIRQFGKKLKSIIICRVGRNGDLLPIDPCDNCQKVADKLNIKINSIFGRNDVIK